MRRHTVLSTLLMCSALSSPTVRAAEAPDALPSDLDALSLADKAPTEPQAVARPWRLFLEGNLRRTSIDDPDSRY